MTTVAEGQRVYFYPHGRLRDRQIDTIRSWRAELVVNPEIATAGAGSQVSSEKALAERVASTGLRLALPLINVKLRPPGLPADVVVYVWGAIMGSGPYIVDLDNPYALTGYNLAAARLYRWALRYLLLQDRCREVRCMSRACRETLGLLLGKAVYDKSTVRYPAVRVPPCSASQPTSACRFLFVSTQFEIKAGPTVLRAFREVHQRFPDSTIDVITHLPDAYRELAEGCPGIRLHAARFTREEVWDRFMCHADVLVHPTFVESFGMVALEGLAHGLGLIVTNVYALGEMVNEGENGFLLDPPINIWDGYRPSREYRNLSSIKQRIRTIDDARLRSDLVTAMSRFASDLEFRRRARAASLQLFRQRFAVKDY